MKLTPAMTFGQAQHIIVRKKNAALTKERLPEKARFRTPDKWAEHKDSAGNIVTMGRVTQADLNEINAAETQQSKGIQQTHTIHLMKHGAGAGFLRFFGNLCGRPWGRVPVSPVKAKSIRKLQVDFDKEQRRSSSKQEVSTPTVKKK